MLDEVMEYCNNVLGNKIPAGINLKNAVSRFISDLKNPAWTFDEEEPLKIRNYISKLKHFTGKHAGKPFLLEPWQLFIIANLYGFYLPDGTRRFQTAYIEMARKQGKTAFVAALSIYHLAKEGEAAPLVLLAANAKDQAKIDFAFVKGFAEGIDAKHTKFKLMRADIELKKKPGMIKTLASDADKLDGYDCSLGIIDEYHEARSTKVRDVIRSSQGIRENPLLITITTAGFDKSLPCWDLHLLATEIAAGQKKDDTFLGIIYAMDEGDNWKDPKNWMKSNPNLGVTVTEKYLQTQVAQAALQPADEVGIKTKNLNLWCDSSSIWIPDEYIIAASKKMNIFDYLNPERPCYMGCDLSSNVDLTAVSYLLTDGEGEESIFYFFNNYFLPRETLEKRNIHADMELYKSWVNSKFIAITAGNVVDYNYILENQKEVNEKSYLRLGYYDKYNATQWAISATDAGINLEPFSQTLANFNGCTKEFERLMLSKRVFIQENPVTKYCLRNVELRRDGNGNVKPDKLKESKKIDGVIAMLQALAAYMADAGNNKGYNIY